MNKLIEVLEVQTYSGKDSLMREYLTKELATIPGVEFYDDKDNIYAWKGVAPFPCMIAHMDTVHKITDNLTAVVINGKITGMNAVKMKQTGIGGDDKVGIYVALQMLKEHPNMKVFFPRDEEIGCIGSSFVQPEFFNDVTIALQCDRRGNSDFIISASGTELSSLAFQADVLPIIQQYGYKFERGMMTDVMELKERGITVSMANISCGYYNPHSDDEYVDVADVHKVTLMVSEIISKLGGTFYHHVAPARPSYTAFTSSFDGEWWNDKPYSKSLGKREHELDNFCQDCWMKPATGANGLCDECWAWYKRDMSVMSKPDYGPSIIRTELDVAKELRKAKERIKRAAAGNMVSHKKMKKRKHRRF